MLRINHATFDILHGCQKHLLHSRCLLRFLACPHRLPKGSVRVQPPHFFPPSARASVITLVMGFISKKSGFHCGKYFTPGLSRFRGGISSLGISILSEASAPASTILPEVF